MDLSLIYQDLSEEQRDEIAALPRRSASPRWRSYRARPPGPRSSKSRNWRQFPTSRTLSRWTTRQRRPLRLINEYQCIPVKPPTTTTASEVLEAHPAPDAADSAGASDPMVDTDAVDPTAPIPLVTLWPPDERMNRWIYASCGRLPEWYLGNPEQVSNTITQRFGVGADSLEESDILTAEAEIEEAEDEDAAVIRFVNEVVQKAVSDRATDIHFEPHRDELQIRYRIDGQLVPIRVPDNLIKFQGAIISRLKIMAKLNISEKRRPQDGRISFGAGDAELDIRISTFPTMYGESVSLRLLNQKSKPLSMRELGLAPREEEQLERALASPHGIILVTGPTGSVNPPR